MRKYAGLTESCWKRTIDFVRDDFKWTTGSKMEWAAEHIRTLKSHGEWDDFPRELKQKITLLYFGCRELKLVKEMRHEKLRAERLF
jgi:hypothetical protein